MKVVVIADARPRGFSGSIDQLNAGRALMSLNILQASMLSLLSAFTGNRGLSELYILIE